MAWHHIEDVEPISGHFVGRSGSEPDKRISTETIALSIWRCGNCRALACGRKGVEPHGPCMKCKNA